jgi:NTP pyrophosphatase (non-canonical NTP hydrolase)
MTREEHLLLCLAEECAEVAQRVSKALRFGLSEVQAGQPLTNAQRIREELNDLLSVETILVDEGIIPDLGPDFTAVAKAKMAKIEKYFAISREQGTLSSEPHHG